MAKWDVCVIQGMYHRAWNCLQVNGQYSEEFSMRVDVHQGSVLSQLRFILVLEVLVHNLCTGVPWELPCALVRVNMKKTKLMVSSFYLDALHKSNNYPCSVCCKRTYNNSTECFQRKLCVHKKCRSITGQLVTVQNYICLRCKGESRPIDGRPMIQVDVEGTKLDVEDTFWYLNDTLCSGGGYDSAIAARCYMAWEKFRKLLPVLTSRHPFPKVLGKVYMACVCRLCFMVVKSRVQTSCT